MNVAGKQLTVRRNRSFSAGPGDNCPSHAAASAFLEHAVQSTNVLNHDRWSWKTQGFTHGLCNGRQPGPTVLSQFPRPRAGAGRGGRLSFYQGTLPAEQLCCWQVYKMIQACRMYSRGHPGLPCRCSEKRPPDGHPIQFAMAAGTGLAQTIFLSPVKDTIKGRPVRPPHSLCLFNPLSGLHHQRTSGS